MADGIGAKGGADRLFLLVGNRGGKGAGIEHQSQILHLLRGKGASNLTTILDLVLDYRCFDHAVIQHNRQKLADIITRNASKACSPITVQGEKHVRAPAFVRSDLGTGQVAASDGGDAVHDIPGLASLGAWPLQKLSVRRQDAAVARERGFPAREGAVLNDLQFKQGRLLDHAPDLGRVADAGKLDYQFVVVLPVIGDFGFNDSQAVDAFANGIPGLLKRLVTEVHRRRGLQRNDARRRVARHTLKIVVGEALVDQRLQIGGILIGYSFDKEMGEISFGDVGVGDVAPPHLVAQALHGFIGGDVDRIIHMHLQDQMGPALEIETQAYAVKDILAKLGNIPGKTDYAENAHQKHAGNDQGAILYPLFHGCCSETFLQPLTSCFSTRTPQEWFARH